MSFFYTLEDSQLENFENLNFLIKKYLMKKCIPTFCHSEECNDVGI